MKNYINKSERMSYCVGAMGQGMMMPYISEEDKNDLLMTRYLD